MHKLVNTKVEKLTRPLAEWFSALPATPGDRRRDTPKGRSRVKWLNRLLREGKFLSPKWATAKMGSETYRVNGGHSSKMLMEANGEFPVGLTVVIDEYVCDSKDDLPIIFEGFDPTGSVRSMKDVVNAHARIHEDLSDVSTTAIDDAIGGIGSAMSNGGDGPRPTPDQRICFIHTHRDFIRWANAFIRTRYLRRTGTVGAMYLSWLKDHAAATEFWTFVRDESHPSNVHPTRRLAVFLRDTIGDTSKKWPNRAYFVKAIHGWNAYRRGTSTDLRYYDDSPIPTVC